MAHRSHIAPRRGFTLIELLVVILILGLLATATFALLEGLSPRYNLRSTARQLGSMIHWARSDTIASGKVYHLHYDFEKKQTWIIFPPGPEDDPELPLDERETSEPLELSDLVRIEKVLLPDGEAYDENDDPIDIPFDPLGFEGSHVVYLRNTEDALLVVKFHALLGLVDYGDTEYEFPTF